MTERILFLDCDGVLADFDKDAEQVFGVSAREWEDNQANLYEGEFGKEGARDKANDEFWARLVQTPDFFFNLDPMPDAELLWNTVQHLNPIIITGCPEGGWAEVQKHRWIRKHFGRRVSMITCASREKSLFCEPGDIIVDDWARHRPKWEQRGGIWVHHENAENSIKQLVELGVLESWQTPHPRCSPASQSNCPNMRFTQLGEGESYHCKVCNESFSLDYNEMR